MNRFRLPALAGAAVLFVGSQQVFATGLASDSSLPEPATCLTIHGLSQVAEAGRRSKVETESSKTPAKTPSKRIEHESKLDKLAQSRYQRIAPRYDSVSVIDPENKSDDSAQGNNMRAGSRRQLSEANTRSTGVPAYPSSPFRVPSFLAAKPAQTVTYDSATLVPMARTVGSIQSPSSQGLASSTQATSAPTGTLASSTNTTTGSTDSKAVEEYGPIATNPQQAVLQDPDASANKKVAISTMSSGDPNSTSATGPKRRGYPAPLDPVFCMTEYIGIAGTMPIGVPDTDPEYPVEKAIYKVLPALKKHRIKIYGWANPSIGKSSSRNSNIPNSYDIVPNRIELDQGIFRVERTPDTVQTEHCDWGFRSTMLYGIDYRWTNSEGWYPSTKQLLQHNYLYGMDPVELYGMFYVPKVAQGMVLKFGRFISPPDIEAQLAPDNFLWTHSQMFTVDCYTQTGVLATIKLNDNWNIQGGISAGADIAPWDKAAIPTGLFLARWVSKTNNDSLYGGINSFNNGRFRGAHAVLGDQQMIQAINTQISQGVANGAQGFVTVNGQPFQYNNLQPEAHDNLQQLNLTWSHRFNKKGTIVTMTEAYFLYQYNALVGGTVINGPPHTYAGLTGPGGYINGIAPAVGVVNYTAFKITDKDYICFRPVDYLMDYKGERTGFPTSYSSWTVGWCHRFNNLVLIRPEIRYDRALNRHEDTIVTPYDNGTRRSQFTFGLDCIARF